MRNVEEIRKIRFPAICKGIIPNIGSFSGYGDVNVPYAEACNGGSKCKSSALEGDSVTPSFENSLERALGLAVSTGPLSNTGNCSPTMASAEAI